MASKMMDCWDQLSTKAIETIISWFKTTDKNSSIAGITKVIKIIKVETIIRGHAITKAATLPPTQSTMVPTRTVLSTSTMLPSGSMLLTRAVPVASPSSQMTVDVAAGMGSPSFDLLPTINWSFLGFLLLLLSVFILTAACLKSLYDHRHLIAALPGLPLRLFNNIPGNGNRGIGIFVIGDTDFHIDDEDMMMARMSRSARRAMASASEKAKRAAGKIGRFVPVSSREAKVKVVQCIYHPFFAGMIVGVTVYYVVNNGFPTVQNRASSGGISTEMAYGSYDAQYQERIRPPWFHPLVQLLVTAFTSIKTHWLLTSVLSMLIAVPYVAIAVIKWHDDLPQERRNEVNRHVDSVRIWFLTIDWPKHRETLVGMGVRCYSGVSTALVKIGDCLSWCSPWLTRACSKLWTGIKWVFRGAWWLLKLFVGGIGTGIFWLINSWESRKLPEVQKELAEYRASQKKNAEKKDREHTTELTKLKTQLKSKDQQITGLDYTNLQLNRSWTVAVNARIQDAQGYNTQLDRAERYSDLDSQHGTNVAKETGAKYRKLLKVHTEQQKEHERDVELFSQHFTELQGKLDQQRTAFCSEYTQQITDLQSSVSTMSAAMKTKFNELEASSTRAGDLERDLRIERAQKEALREDFSNQYFQLSKSFDDFKSLHQSCVSCSDHQALRQELDQTKSAKGGDRTTENELKATLATVQKELADAKATNDLFKKKGNFNAFAAYSAKFPNGTTYQPQPTTDQQTLGLDALCFSLKHQYGFTSLTVADLQRVCNEFQPQRVEPDNGFVHDPNQLAAILGRWSEQQQRPLAFGYRTTTQVSGKFSVFDILKFASKSREVVWVTRRTPGEAQEGAQPGDPSVGTWFGLQARDPTPDQSEGGTGVAGPSNDQAKGNDNPPDGKAAADTSGPKGEQSPQNGQPSSTNASTPGKNAGPSKDNTEPQPPSTAEEEFKGRFPKGFKIMDGGDPGEMSGLQATIMTMNAMQEEAKYKSMPVPTYDELDEIRDSPEGRKALEKAYGGEFGEDNINAAGINYVLNLWGKQRGLNLQLGTMRRKPGEVNQPKGHGFLEDIVDLGITTNPNVDGANCIVVWIYNDDGADPTVGFYAEWAGLRPRLTIGGAASKAKS